MMKNYKIGIDIGGTFVKFGLFEKEQLIRSWKTDTPAMNAEGMLSYLLDRLLSVVREEGIETKQLQSVGIGIPASVTREGIVQDAPNIGWKQVDALKIWHMLTDIPLFIGNDANAAALGEYYHGGGKGYSSMVFVTLGTGVGSGVIVDGRLLAGSHGMAGELGHMAIEPEEQERCNCGKRGCLEQYASANGVVRVARTLLSDTDTASVLRQKEQPTSKDVFEAAAQKDELAVRVAEKFGETLGRAFSYMSECVDPDIFVLGGGMSGAGEILIDYVSKYYQKYVFSPAKNTPIVLAQLGNEAGIYGAMELAAHS